MNNQTPTEVCSELIRQAEVMEGPNAPITKLNTQTVESITNNKLISANYQTAIQEAYTKPELWMYYSNKFNWDENHIEMIDWHSHGKSLTSLPQLQQIQ
jgi:hypothetical protein